MFYSIIPGSPYSYIARCIFTEKWISAQNLDIFKLELQEKRHNTYNKYCFLFMELTV